MPKRFAVHTANCLLHKFETLNRKPATCQKSQTLGIHYQIDLSTKKKTKTTKHQLSQKSFIDFQLSFMDIELGIKTIVSSVLWHKISRYLKLRSHVTKIFMAQKSTEAHRILTFMEIKKRRVTQLKSNLLLHVPDITDNCQYVQAPPILVSK